MPAICLYLHCHQPQRMKKFSVFEIGSHEPYFDDEMNRRILQRIARKSYLPTNRMLLKLIKDTGGKFKVNLSITGVLLEQLEKDFPDVLKSFQDLAASGSCELVAETYYHSLASMYSPDEFASQVKMQRDKLKELFAFTPRVFRNTELMYTNSVAAAVKDMGFTGILAEGWDKVLGWRSPNFVYKADGSDIALLMRNYRLSDDIAFRFSNRDWKHWPLTAEKYVDWVNQLNIGGAAQTINLFMDYETFGEHQWEETGIFNFFDAFAGLALQHPQNRFTTLSELIQLYEPVDSVDVPYPLSWADTERDLSAWTGNKMQQAAIENIYSLEAAVKRSGDAALLKDWRKLQTSDHFYYMCTKWFSDGDVHKYFNPYESPYESFITFMNIFNDLRIRTDQSARQETGDGRIVKNEIDGSKNKGRQKLKKPGANHGSGKARSGKKNGSKNSSKNSSKKTVPGGGRP